MRPNRSGNVGAYSGAAYGIDDRYVDTLDRVRDLTPVEYNHKGYFLPTQVEIGFDTDGAACQRIKHLDWRSDDERMQERCKHVCNVVCPKRDECRAVAIADPDALYVWGGTTYKERQKLRRSRRPKKIEARLNMNKRGRWIARVVGLPQLMVVTRALKGDAIDELERMVLASEYEGATTTLPTIESWRDRKVLHGN